jgi:hypothetical protein
MAAFTAPLCKATRHSELVCTTINTRRKISFVWRFSYADMNVSFRSVELHQASPFAVLGTYAPGGSSKLSKSPG